MSDNVLTIKSRGRIYSRYKVETLIEIPVFVEVPKDFNIKEECAWLECDYLNILRFTENWRHEGYDVHPIFMFQRYNEDVKEYVVGMVKVNYRRIPPNGRRKIKE